MKRLVALGLAILVLVLAAYAVIAQLPGFTAGSGADDAPATSAMPRPADATLSHVAFVHDGDTLYLQPDGTTSRADEITVRLIGIDTPELRPEVECYAIEARDHLRALLPQGSEVWIAADRGEFDQYGRTLLYLWTKDGRSVNLDLVEEGYATALRIAPNDEYWPQLRAAEHAAEDAGAGMWGRC
jgi:endonuclease YncB( thermonuclease family)